MDATSWFALPITKGWIGRYSETEEGKKCSHALLLEYQYEESGLEDIPACGKQGCGSLIARNKQTPLPRELAVDRMQLTQARWTATARCSKTFMQEESKLTANTCVVIDFLMSTRMQTPAAIFCFFL